MLPPKKWPKAHTDFLLDYIDNSGDTLATPGLRRKKGYETLRKLLNTRGVPRPLRPYSVEEINAHCLFLKEQYSAYQGPNLKGFFSNGRAYLSPPLGTAERAVRDTESEAMSAIASSASAGVTPIRSIPSQHLPSRSQYTFRSTISPSRRSISQDARRKKVTPLQREIPPSNLDNATVHRSPYEPTSSTFVPWEDLFYLRSGKCRVSIQVISPAMIRLKRNAEKAVDSYLENGDVSLLPQPNIGHIKQNHRELADLLGSVVQEKNTAAILAGKISNTTLLRSLIAWAVYKWVFLDPFPVLGTEQGGIWDDLKEMLKERGGDQVMDDFENLRLDLQFRLSEKAELTEQALPARADELARKFASILEPLFSTSDGRGQQALVNTNKEKCVISDVWISRLRKTFLDALEIIVQLRQREIVTEFTWPEPGVTFDDLRLQAENNGTKFDFEGKPVLLTLVPGAFSWIPSDDKRGEMEEILYHKATVFLDIDDGFSS